MRRASAIGGRDQGNRAKVTQNRTIAAAGLALIATIAIVGALLLPMPGPVFSAFVAGAAAIGCIIALRPADAIVEAEERGAEVVASTPDPHALLDAADEPMLLVRDRRVLIANAAARDLLGDHVEGEDVRLAIRHPAAAERLLDDAGDADERATRTDLAGLGDPGQRWEMATSLLPDGTRLVRLIDRSHAHAAEQMRVDFVANASHELRTPLATLLGFLETLEDEEVAADAGTRRKFLTIMTDEAARMRALVDDLMSLSRVEADRYSLPREPVDLIGLIEDVRTALARLIEQRGSALSVENQAERTVVAGDRTQLTQLLTNLVTNALRYGRSGTPVHIRLTNAGSDMIRLAVIDQGEGIAAEHLPRLTERFYRIDASRSRAVGGTGLGLAIVKHIALRHRGRLDIRSTPGEGTSARVYLPVHQG